MTKMLVPVDGSDQSAQAAVWAAQRASESGGSVTLIHVHMLPGAEAMGLAHLSKEEVERATQSEASPSFEKARAAIGDISPIEESIAVIGDAADEIIYACKTGDFNHIVMGSRGLSPLGEILLGSVSERVIREAHCAVTVIR